jgi:hypothetical protein
MFEFVSCSRRKNSPSNIIKSANAVAYFNPTDQATTVIQWYLNFTLHLEIYEINII